MRGKQGREVNQCNIHLPPDLIHRLDKRAGELTVSRSSYVRMLLINALKDTREE